MLSRAGIILRAGLNPRVSFTSYTTFVIRYISDQHVRNGPGQIPQLCIVKHTESLYTRVFSHIRPISVVHNHRQKQN
jgi:hypothetical protein